MAVVKDHAPVCLRIGLLAATPSGSQRERLADPLPDGYRQTYEQIDGDPGNAPVVAALGGRVAGVLLPTVIPYLICRGGRPALVEGFV